MVKTRRKRRAEAIKRLEMLGELKAKSDLLGHVLTAALYDGNEDRFMDSDADNDKTLLIDLLKEDTCEMVDMWEREDADGCIWPDGWQCTSCGEMVLGVMPEPSTMLMPKYCPNCGEKVRTSHDQD